jgi:hypothetical protein
MDKYLVFLILPQDIGIFFIISKNLLHVALNCPLFNTPFLYKQ